MATGSDGPDTQVGSGGILTGRGGDDLIQGGGGGDADALVGGAAVAGVTGFESFNDLGSAVADEHITGDGADSFVVDGPSDRLGRSNDFDTGFRLRPGCRPGLLVGWVGPLPPNLDTAVGTGPQFVLIDLGANDKLVFDADGSEQGEAVGIAILKGESGLTAGDIELI